MDDQEALQLIFHSGISTSPAVTEISGRGLGMAIVRSKAEALGGHVRVESRPTVGTTVYLALPLTVTTFRGVIIASAGRTYVVPTVNVDRVLRVRMRETPTGENRVTLALREGDEVPVVRLDAVLGVPPASAGKAGPLTTMVVLHSGGRRVAFAVDDVLHEEEVLVKPFPRPIMRIRYIGGATILGSGDAAPILNVADLMRSPQVKKALAIPAATGAGTP
jgi:two-component system chemotaxis sensor kinase CheA